MARNNLYPPSVTPGIPKLGTKPSGWMDTTFGDVLKVVKRKAEIADETKYQLVTARRNRGGIVPREVLQGKEILTKTQFYIKAEDFLISRRQIIHGACGVVPPELDGAIVSNEYATLHTQNHLLMSFLQYYSHTTYFQQTCFQSSVGVDVEKMIFDLDSWLKCRVYLPPVEEQRKIVGILGTWDKAIQLTQELIAAKEQRKKGLMQQLLTGQVRFPEFGHSKIMKKTCYGLVPSDWNFVHLTEIAEVNANSLSNETAVDKTFHYIDLSAVDKGKIIFPEDTSAFYSLPSRARRILKEGDVIMSTVRPNLLAYAICNFEPLDVLCSTGFALISPNDKKDSQFIYQSLYSDVIQSQLYGLVTGSNYPAINSLEVAALSFIWPSLAEERQKIATILQACDREIHLLQQKLAALQEQKKGLMQRLLTGQVRIKTETALTIIPPFAEPLTPLQLWTIILNIYFQNRYGTLPGRIHVNKMPYAIQEIIKHKLGLLYTAGSMGPYSEDYHHLCEEMEGIYITGYGRGHDDSLRAYTIKALSGVIEPAERFKQQNPTVAHCLQKLDWLLDGFDDPRFLELLATVHFLKCDRLATTKENIVYRVHHWEQEGKKVKGRKAWLFSESDILAVWERLCQFEQEM